MLCWGGMHDVGVFCVWCQTRVIPVSVDLYNLVSTMPQRVCLRQFPRCGNNLSDAIELAKRRVQRVDGFQQQVRFFSWLARGLMSGRVSCVNTLGSGSCLCFVVSRRVSC